MMMQIPSRCMSSKRIKLHPDFADRIAKYDIGMNEMADLANIGRSTLYALQNPEAHGERARGGMHRRTAWKLIRAFSERAGVPEEQARSLLLIEVDEPPRLQRETDTDDE
jgi:hypothetical protein